MPRIMFLKDFDWKPLPSVTQSYKAGRTYMVTTRCATRAKAKGFAVSAETPPPRRKEPTYEATERRATDGADDVPEASGSVFGKPAW